MDDIKSSNKFSFKQKSSSAVSSTQPVQTSSNLDKVKSTAKQKFTFVDEDSDDDGLLPLDPVKNMVEIKPKPLFKINTKTTKNSESSGSSLFKLAQKYTSTQVCSSNSSREDKQAVGNDISTIQPTQNSSNSDNSIESLSSPSNKFSFRKPKNNTEASNSKVSPRKSTDSLKILDQLSSAINNIKQSPTKLIHLKDQREECLSNSSTPELPIADIKPSARKSLDSTLDIMKEDTMPSAQKSLDETITSKINTKTTSHEIEKMLITVPAVAKTNHTRSIKDAKMEFLEHYFNIHSSIPLSIYDDIKEYDKSLTIKLKRAIYSLDRAQRLSEKNEAKSSPPIVHILDKPRTPPVSKPTAITYQDDDDDDDEQFNIDQIINDVNDERRKSTGKFDNNYIDLSNSLSSASVNSKFDPRINMRHANMPVPQTVTRNHTSAVEELDEDGFPIIDYSQLEDVVPSPPKASTSRQSAVNDGKTTKVKVDTVDTLIIPDCNESLKIKISNELGKFHSSVKNDGITGEFDGYNYDFSQELRTTFRTVFGLRTFRQNQLQAINATLLGKDCFILMPTGKLLKVPNFL